MLENVKIEKGVPVPKSRKRTDQRPWCDMVPGDSFFGPALTTLDTDPPAIRELSGLEKSKLRKALMHLGHKYFGPGNYSVLAAVNSDNVPGFRVWRRA